MANIMPDPTCYPENYTEVLTRLPRPPGKVYWNRFPEQLYERVTYVGRTETERKPYQFRVTIRNVESTHENPYGVLVTSVEQGKLPQASAP
jgi:hypothetical protein